MHKKKNKINSSRESLFLATGIAMALFAFAIIAPQFYNTSLNLSTASASEPAQVHRFWSGNYNHHFYTISQSEKDLIEQNDPNWAYEGVAYNAYLTPQDFTDPVYRFYSPVFKGHFYTKSVGERDQIIINDPNWNYEGVAYHVRGEGIAIYRFYSENFNGHFYTTDETEKENLIENDPNWIYEGIAFYGDLPDVPTTPITPPDNTPPGDTAPTITSLEAQNPTLTSIEIVWATDEPTTSYVSYGTSQGSYTQQTATTTASTLMLTGLNSDTTYYYILTVEDADGTQIISTERLFATSGTTPPAPQCGNGIIESGEQCDDSNIVSGDGCSSTCQTEVPAFTLDSQEVQSITQTAAYLLFTFSEVAQAYIEYGISTGYGSQTSGETSFNYATHGQTISGLSPDTTYHYRIHGTNQAGTDIVSPDYTFTTASPTNLAPVFSGMIIGQTITQGSSASLNVGQYFSDPEGQTLTFGLSPSSDLLPTNLTLSSSGVIAGTANAIGSTTNVIVRATDVGGLTADSNVFVITITNPPPSCGNNVTESGEQCDDGNITSGDGCSAICQTESSTTPACGTDHEKVLSVPPTNLCSGEATAAQQTGSGPWEWVCLGSDDEIVGICNAATTTTTTTVIGQCGNTLNTCSAGDFIDTADTATEVRWGCVGSGGFETFTRCAQNL